MHALIVFAHPEPSGSSRALKDTALHTLTSLGWSIEVSNLYAEGFDAAPGPGDVRVAQSTDHAFSRMRAQRKAATTGGYAEQIARGQQRSLNDASWACRTGVRWGDHPINEIGVSERDKLAATTGMSSIS